MSGIIKPLPGSQLNLDHSLAQGLVGCWLFNEGAGTKDHDYSGKGNTGTLTGFNNPPIATSGWNAGPHGGALIFDGINDYVICGNSLNLLPDIFTIIAWYQCKGNNIDFPIMSMATRHPSFRVNMFLYYKLGITMGVNNYRNFAPVGGGTDTNLHCAAFIITGQGQNDILNSKAYLDGKQLTASDTVSTGAVEAKSGPVWIGQFNSYWYADNLISSVMIFNRVLSTDEIAYLYAFPFCMFDEPSNNFLRYLTIEILGASAQVENVKRSLEKYIWDNIYITEGISVDFLGLPFNNKNSIEWIVPRFLINRTYISRASGTEYGYDNNIVLGITINVKKSSLTITDKHYLIRDSIIKYFKIGEDIDLNNWVGDGSFICKMRVREVIEDSSMRETNDLLSYKVVLGINYTESSMLDY